MRETVLEREGFIRRETESVSERELVLDRERERGERERVDI